MSKIGEAFSAFDALFRGLSDRIQTLEKKVQADNKQRFDFRMEKEAINAHINRVQADTEKAIGEIHGALGNLTNRVDMMESKADCLRKDIDANIGKRQVIEQIILGNEPERVSKDPQEKIKGLDVIWSRSDEVARMEVPLYGWDLEFSTIGCDGGEIIKRNIKVLFVTTKTGKMIPRPKVIKYTNVFRWTSLVGPTCLVFGIRDDGKPVAMRWKSLCDHYDLVMS